ncbi:hypothetical protein LTR64_005902 [Lithohypha guttulata]|uniref:uncharacterized protein n=1 Tax=Lithohypha guttulata TaxID=1690604 RepID=UPI002DDF54FE|nr:hypothetical protein LTR51_002301 [Lithohypha guttulata]
MRYHDALLFSCASLALLAAAKPQGGTTTKVVTATLPGVGTATMPASDAEASGSTGVAGVGSGTVSASDAGAADIVAAGAGSSAPGSGTGSAASPASGAAGAGAGTGSAAGTGPPSGMDAGGWSEEDFPGKGEWSGKVDWSEYAKHWIEGHPDGWKSRAGGQGQGDSGVDAGTRKASGPPAGAGAGSAKPSGTGALPPVGTGSMQDKRNLRRHPRSFRGGSRPDSSTKPGQGQGQGPDQSHDEHDDNHHPLDIDMSDFHHQKRDFARSGPSWSSILSDIHGDSLKKRHMEYSGSNLDQQHEGDRAGPGMGYSYGGRGDGGHYKRDLPAGHVAGGPGWWAREKGHKAVA